MGEEGEKLIFGRVGRDQFLSQAHVARLVFDQEQHALHVLLRILQAEQIDVHEIGHAGAIDQRLLDKLKGRAEGEHFLDRFRRCDVHLLIGRFAHFLFRRQAAKASRHLPKSFVRLKESPRLGIDQGDAARHVRQDLIVENDFALDPRGRFALTPVKFAGQPGDNGGADDQPARQKGHLFSRTCTGR